MGCEPGCGAFPWFCGGEGGEGEGLSPWMPGGVHAGLLGRKLEWVGVPAGPARRLRGAQVLSFLSLCPPGHRQRGPAPQQGGRDITRVGGDRCVPRLTAVPAPHVGGEGS